MEISEKEYYELQRQVRTLQSQVDAMNGPKKISLLDMIDEQVISSVHTADSTKPVFVYLRRPSDAWKMMLTLAKKIHEPSRLFNMRRSVGCYNGNYRPYIDFVSGGNCPRKISDMTEKQQEISARMLNEIIPIYNRYFKLMHQQVLYDPTGKGEYELYGVVDEQEVRSEVEFE